MERCQEARLRSPIAVFHRVARSGRCPGASGCSSLAFAGLSAYQLVLRIQTSLGGPLLLDWAKPLMRSLRVCASARLV